MNHELPGGPLPAATSYARMRTLVWLRVACPACGAAAGGACVSRTGKRLYDPHAARRSAASG